ncbi:CG0192-related protein [Cellulomonas timonensis]|uniref:CG0192-related protein n=1 Tax=Cellulomonas timonensis TaxID=1689271 RepID=UPI0008338F77|nr:hypothetical protein [Cellulomonas timonensis]
MALLYSAQLRPTKFELLAGWLPAQQWFAHDPGAELGRLGAFRLDDPAGEVGVEVLLVEVEGEVLQVPLAYRGAPLPGAEQWLVGTMEHSVLGSRWVYDACADPVYANVLAAVMRGDAAQAEEVLVGEDGVARPRAASVTVGATGPAATLPEVAPLPDDSPAPCATSGSVTAIRLGAVDLAVRRVLDLDARGQDLPGVVATWPGQADPVLLVAASPA